MASTVTSSFIFTHPPDEKKRSTAQALTGG